MTEVQADTIINLLADLLSELRGMRSEFNEFTGYNVYSMSTVVADISDNITGRIGGAAGSSLDDLSTQLDTINSTLGIIEINTGS